MKKLAKALKNTGFNTKATDNNKKVQVWLNRTISSMEVRIAMDSAGFDIDKYNYSHICGMVEVSKK